jgi:hypothetical protein
MLALMLAVLLPLQTDSPGPGQAAEADPFPIAVWVQSPDKALRYKELGINTYVGLWRGPTTAQVDALEKAGMRIVCDASERALREFKDRRSIIAWMHGDEPDNAQALPGGKGYGPPVPPEKIVEDYKRIKAADPSRPVLLNLGQGVAWDGWYGRGVRTNHPEDYPLYLEGCDIASFDIYPASHDRAEVAGKLEFVPRGVDRLHEWTGGKKPVWCCIETTRISNPDRAPTPAEVRSEVWLALIHGADGLIYFCHQFEPRFIEAGFLADEAMAAAIGVINRQIHELAPVLRSPELPEAERARVESSSAEVPIDAMSRRVGGSYHVFAAAARAGETTATFTVPGLGDARVEVIGEGRAIEARAGAWTDTFGPYEVHLYRVAPAR